MNVTAANSENRSSSTPASARMPALQTKPTAVGASARSVCRTVRKTTYMRTVTAAVPSAMPFRNCGRNCRRRSWLMICSQSQRQERVPDCAENDIHEDGDRRRAERDALQELREELPSKIVVDDRQSEPAPGACAGLCGKRHT